jgi:3-deoxy-7-phosphoheptulonate synthase
VLQTEEPVVFADPDVIAGLDYWRTLPIKQQPEWADPTAVAAASAEIATFPPLVFAGEVDTLRERLATAPRPSPTPRPTISATASRRSCRWPSS